MASKNSPSTLMKIPQSIGSDDHWVTLVIAIAAIVIVGVTTDLRWYWLLTIGMLVSGIVELAIKGFSID